MIVNCRNIFENIFISTFYIDLYAKNVFKFPFILSHKNTNFDEILNFTKVNVKFRIICFDFNNFTLSRKHSYFG